MCVEQVSIAASTIPSRRTACKLRLQVPFGFSRYGGPSRQTLELHVKSNFFWLRRSNAHSKLILLSTGRNREAFQRGKAGVLVQDIGLETLGGVFTPLLKRGLPASLAKQTQIFSTADDNQSQIKISLFRGSTNLTKSFTSYGLEVVGIRPMARGPPQVAVTLSATDDAISISAFDKETANL